ncbi:MAG: ParB/RepB/Spo0J family partition protein, partial [Anaerolineae bacterium]|nr:ParB/RepB/Spo0J family partition protein [Anaerolineae bacterium]
DALIPVSDSSNVNEASQDSSILEILIDDISPNPRQPRTTFNYDELEELAVSIQEHGIIQPLIVTHGSMPGIYTLVAGERRWQAAKKAGLDRVPVILRETTDQERLELALIENIQRTDLSPLESAEAYRHLAEDFNLSQDEISNALAKAV